MEHQRSTVIHTLQRGLQNVHGAQYMGDWAPEGPFPANQQISTRKQVAPTIVGNTVLRQTANTIIYGLFLPEISVLRIVTHVFPAKTGLLQLTNGHRKN